VFVHGLGGPQIGTWTDPESKKTWISDPEFLGSLQDISRILAFGYNANILENVTVSRIRHHAADLLEKLLYERRTCPVRQRTYRMFMGSRTYGDDRVDP
jgi:hypothetical protein